MGWRDLRCASEVLRLKYRLLEQVYPGYGFDAIALLSRGTVLVVERRVVFTTSQVNDSAVSEPLLKAR